MRAATTYALDRGVATITLCRPEARNSLSTSLLDGLGDGLARAVADPSVRAIVLTNEGTTFCAGADLRGGDDGPGRHDLTDVLRAIVTSPVPVIGRIAGHCMGGGVGLAAACDLSVIVDDAKVGFTEVRLGVAPAMISVVCLPKLRRGDALELFLTGERITAARAVEVGLLTEVAAPEALDDAVEALVRQVVAGGPEALAAAKRLVYDGVDQDLDRGLARMAERSAALFASDEAAEGIAAFRARRTPNWVPIRER